MGWSALAWSLLTGLSRAVLDFSSIAGWSRMLPASFPSFPFSWSQSYLFPHSHPSLSSFSSRFLFQHFCNQILKCLGPSWTVLTSWLCTISVVEANDKNKGSKMCFSDAAKAWSSSSSKEQCDPGFRTRWRHWACHKNWKNGHKSEETAVLPFPLVPRLTAVSVVWT